MMSGRSCGLCMLVIAVVSTSAAIQTEVVTPPAQAYTAMPDGVLRINTLLRDSSVISRNDIPDSSPHIRLTPCAQAILGCCAGPAAGRQYCFEQVGCGPHVFGDPCDRQFMTQALDGAERFYSQAVQQTVP